MCIRDRVNNCFCSKCNKVQDIFKGKFLPIDENGILKYKARCKHCENIVTKPIDYSKFKNILKEFGKENLHLVLQKGIYPYEWVDNYKKFKEQLPLDKKDWYSTLNNEGIWILLSM